jgi:hypothetical protein
MHGRLCADPPRWIRPTGSEWRITLGWAARGNAILIPTIASLQTTSRPAKRSFLTASLFGERWGGMANRWRPQNSESNSRSWTRLSPGWKMKLPNKKQRHAAGYEKDAPAGTRQTGCDRWSAEDQRRTSGGIPGWRLLTKVCPKLRFPPQAACGKNRCSATARRLCCTRFFLLLLRCSSGRAMDCPFPRNRCRPARYRCAKPDDFGTVGRPAHSARFECLSSGSPPLLQRSLLAPWGADFWKTAAGPAIIGPGARERDPGPSATLHPMAIVILTPEDTD